MFSAVSCCCYCCLGRAAVPAAEVNLSDVMAKGELSGKDATYYRGGAADNKAVYRRSGALEDDDAYHQNSAVGDNAAYPHGGEP
jgi:hypothetical protein